MIRILFQVYCTSLLIAFAAGIVSLYFNKKAPFYLRIFPWFMLLIFLEERFAYYWAGKYGSNHGISNIFLMIQFLFYSFVLYSMLQRATVKKGVLYAVGIYLLIAIPLIFFIQGIHYYNSIVYFIGGLILCFFSGYYLLELFRIPGMVNQFQMPSFWIACGILLFHSCTMPIVIPWPFLLNCTPFELKILHIVLTLVYCISYLMFAVGLVCHLKARTFSISPK